jgi:hypothetical protein
MTTQQGGALHQAALQRPNAEGNPPASQEAALSLLAPLAAELQRKFPAADAHLVWDGVADALRDHLQKPRVFDASRGIPLERFLARAAWRNVADLLRREASRKRRETEAAESFNKLVALGHPAANIIWNEENILNDATQAALEMALADPADRKVLQLMAMGERRTAVFAGAMGLSHLSAEQQRLEVKRAKDRIRKALQRHKPPRK